MSRTKKNVAGMDPTEAQKFVAQVGDVWTAMDHQKHVVAGAAEKLRDERTKLRKLEVKLIEVTKPLPLYDAPPPASAAS